MLKGFEERIVADCPRATKSEKERLDVTALLFGHLVELMNLQGGKLYKESANHLRISQLVLPVAWGLTGYHAPRNIQSQQ